MIIKYTNKIIITYQASKLGVKDRHLNDNRIFFKCNLFNDYFFFPVNNGYSIFFRCKNEFVDGTCVMSKNNDNAILTYQLEMHRYLSEKYLNATYTLVSSVNHFGKHLNSGHYTATTFEEKRCVSYNDATVL